MAMTPAEDAQNAPSTGERPAAPTRAVPLRRPGTGATQHPRRAAFFDVDNTLMRGGVPVLPRPRPALAPVLLDPEIVTAGWHQLKFRVVGSEDPDDVRLIREQALAFIAGWPVADLVELAAEIFDEVLTTKVWPGTAALAQHHLDHGERVWLVTAAPVEIAQLIADRLHLTGGLGTVAETVDGYYTGRLVGDLLHGAAKADAVRLLAAEEGLDLSLCSAYSDSANDVPMLSLGRHAVRHQPRPAAAAARPRARLAHPRLPAWPTRRRAPAWRARPSSAPSAVLPPRRPPCDATPVGARRLEALTWFGYDPKGSHASQNVSVSVGSSLRCPA